MYVAGAWTWLHLLSLPYRTGSVHCICLDCDYYPSFHCAYAGVSELLTCKVVVEDRSTEHVDPGACVQVNRTSIPSFVVFEDTGSK